MGSGGALTSAWPRVIDLIDVSVVKDNEDHSVMNRRLTTVLLWTQRKSDACRTVGLDFCVGEAARR
jgi:hypothetical protein